jgi:hypothetical protein
MTGARTRSAARVVVLLVIGAQLADLASFGMVARALGPAGELGPLGAVYAAGGFVPVAAVKLLGLAAALCLLALYDRIVGSPRRPALVVAAIGLLGAATNLASILGAL